MFGALLKLMFGLRSKSSYSKYVYVQIVDVTIRSEWRKR